MENMLQCGTHRQENTRNSSIEGLQRIQAEGEVSIDSICMVKIIFLTELLFDSIFYLEQFLIRILSK